MYDALLTWGFSGISLLILAGMIILIGGGECLVRGAGRLAVALRIPPLIVGLTVVAFCTSAPELAVSLNAALSGKADIAVGNVVGSNICNVCLILGLTALLCPITVSSKIVRREIPLMIAVSVLAYGLAVSGGSGTVSGLLEGKYEGHLASWEGGLLVGILPVYIVFVICELLWRRDRNRDYARGIEEEVVPPGTDVAEKITGTGNLVVNFCAIIVGVAMLVAGADMLVAGGAELARKLGVGELVIGLTILAIGSSLPELVVCVLAAVRGKSDLAVGNAVGSNLFNLLAVLGAGALFSPGGLNVSGQALQFDFPLMILVSVFCIVICVTGRRVSRAEGFFLLLVYAGYLAFLTVSGPG